MADWPVYEDARAWLGISSGGGSAPIVLNDCVEAATEMVTLRCDPDKLPTDGSCPPTIRLLVLALAKDLFGLRDTRSGQVSAEGMAVLAAKLDRDMAVLMFGCRVDPEP